MGPDRSGGVALEDKYVLRDVVVEAKDGLAVFWTDFLAEVLEFTVRDGVRCRGEAWCVSRWRAWLWPSWPEEQA
jgi:hypothetical protein